jgi:hypothetical protein
MCRRPLRGGTNNSTTSEKRRSATLSLLRAAEIASVPAISVANSRYAVREPKADDAEMSSASTMVSSRLRRNRSRTAPGDL